MKKDIFYSIIVVCLNAGERLDETIESILKQKYKNFEIVLKDGGSTDGSADRIKNNCMDNRLHIYNCKDNGIYDAMNQAVSMAEGEYLLFLNAGDSFYDEMVLEKITHEIQKLKSENKNADIVYGNMYHKSLDTIIYASPEINDFTCYRNVPCHQTCFYSKSMFRTRGYNTVYNVRADYEHFLWCFYEAKADICYVPVIVAAYEGGGYSETKYNKKLSAKQHREITVHYMGRKKADKYRRIMLLTMQPLRSAIADNKHLSGVYNSLKTTVYKIKKR